MLQCQTLHLIVIDKTGLLVELVAYCLVEHTRHIYGRAVREVATVREVKTHKGIAGFEASEEDCHISLCARVRLYVSPSSTVEFADTVDSELLNLIHHATTAIVASVRIALCIFVGQYGAHSLHYLIAHEVLRSNQLNATHLTSTLGSD